MMKPIDFTRRDCLLGRTRISYDKLQRDYVCNLCGGGIVVRTTEDYGDVPIIRVECSQCHGQEFISP